MKNFRVFSLLALTAFPVVVQAQPDLNNVPKGNNPTNRPVGGARNLTPEARFKRQLEQANIKNAAQQDAVITYVTGEMEARQKMLKTAQTLQTSLRNRNVTDAQVAGLLNDYSASLADDKARRQKALATLKAAIDVSLFPRLEAMLTLAGLYGDAPMVSLSGMNTLGGGRQILRGRDKADANANAVGGARGNVDDRRNRRARNENQNVPF